MANGISFSGLGSGIDFSIIRDAIISDRSRPINSLQGKVNLYNARIESLKGLNVGLSDLLTSAESLTNRNLGFGRTTSTSDSTIATAQADSNTTVGGYDLEITRLATNLTQTSRSYASEETEVLAGAATTATFELRKGGNSEGTSITIDSSNNTLAGLRDAINAADAGVKAVIVDVNGNGTDNQLVLTSDESGSNGRVELVETTSTGTLTDLNLSSINPPDGDFSNLNAAFSINGLNLTRSSNSITDAIEGVTFTLKDIGSVSLSVSPSNEIENKLRSFIIAYNTIQESVKGQYNTDGIGRPTGVLAGESTLRSVQQQLRQTLRTISEDNGGSLTGLSQLGISVNDDGTLALDTAILNEQLTSNPEDVRSLLYGKTENDKGIFNSIETVVEGLADDVTGTVQTAIKGYQTSVESLNKSISNRLEAIDRLRESLTRQFAITDAAIGQLNGQQTALTSIIKSLEPRDS